MIRARYFVSEGELERAEQDYKKLTTLPEQGAMGYELLGNFYAGNKQLDKAIEALEQGSKAYPENLRLERRLMKTLFIRAQAEDTQKALEILAALEKRLPQDPELMQLRAIQLLGESTPGSLNAAKNKLEEVIKLEPTAVDAHLTLIRIAMQEERYEDARDSAIRAFGSNPDNPALLSARARTELLLENTQMAIQLAQSALQKDPNDVQARVVLTAVAIDSKDPDLLEQSGVLIESALRGDPNNEQLLISRAFVMEALDSPQTAIPELEDYCRTQEGSRSVDAIAKLADLYRLSGDMDQAKLRIEQAEKIDPGNLTVIHARFLLLLAQKQYDKLSQISSEYLTAKKQNATTLIKAAYALMSLDSIELKKEGLKLFEQAVTIAPTSKDARFGLANALYQTGETSQAVTIYQELLKDYPKDLLIINNLAWIMQEHDHSYDAALELTNRGLILSPDNIELLDTRGTILANMENRLADARKDYERLVELTPSDSQQKASALLRLGRICIKLNDLAQAKQHFQDALEIDQEINVFNADEHSEIAKIL
jgi:tetratricopeptide (TPR) repeat protein